MSFLKVSPLGKRIVIPANLIAAVSLVALSAFLVIRNDRDSRRQLDARAASMAVFLQQASASYITNYDLSALELFAKQVVKGEDFSFAVYLDEGHKPLTTAVAQEVEAASKVVEEPIKDTDGKVIGFIRVGYVTRRIEAVLRQRIALSLVGILVSQVFLAVGLGWVVSRVRRRLKALYSQLRLTAEHTLHQANIVRASSQSVADGARRQEASTATATSSLAEIEGKVRELDEKARAASETAAQASRSTVSGVEQITALVQAMADIKASSNEIRKILKSIDEIAFQTNILALNAAVEAARAGEAGAGFAVVADEVRALAQRSATAARESADKIEAALAKSNRGDTITTSVAASLKDIHGRVDELCGLVKGMATASHEQSQGIAQVNSEVTEIGKVTHQSGASAIEGTRVAEELNRQASSLQEQIEGLGELIESSPQHGAADITGAAEGETDHADDTSRSLPHAA
jgi:methyl-accepting chemotaxis protein